MQNLFNIGKKQTSTSESKTADVWRAIISSCAMGDTLILDFSVPTSGSAKSKVATCSGNVTAVVEKSKRAPKIMFRAEGFREQVQLPPVVVVDCIQAPNTGLKGNDAASLLEFLSTSKLVGASVLRKERAESAQKAIISIGTRKVGTKPQEVAATATAVVPSAAEEKEAPAQTVVYTPTDVIYPPNEGYVKPEGFVVKPEPNDEEVWGTMPHYILTPDQKRSQMPTLFERLYIDEATAAHVGAGLLLSMLSCTNSSPISDIPQSFAAPSRFQEVYTSGSTAAATNAAAKEIETVTGRQYDDEDEVEGDAYSTELSASSGARSKGAWETVGAGAFATVYKVSEDVDAESSEHAVKVVRSMLHSAEENQEDGPLGVFQKVSAHLRASVTQEHVSSCPHAFASMGMSSKAASAMAKTRIASLRTSVGLLSKRKRNGEGNLNEQLRLGALEGGSQWYDVTVPANEPKVDLVDVYHMEIEAAGNKGRSRRAHIPRLSFMPFSKEVVLMLEWRDWIAAELQRSTPHLPIATGDVKAEARLVQAQSQHCYSMYLGPVGGRRRLCTEVIRTATKEAAKPSDGLSVADIFASRRVADPASLCGMTIQRPTVSTCRLGFSAGSLGVRQSVVGELINLQLCTGKTNVVPLWDWGYRAPRVQAAIQSTVTYLVSLIENTTIGSIDHYTSQQAVLEQLVPFQQVPPSLVTNLIASHISADTQSGASNYHGYYGSPMFPTIEHLMACAQAHLSLFGIPSMMEGVVGIVTPHYDHPLHRLQRKVASTITDRKVIVDMIESEFKERIGVLRSMNEFREKREKFELSRREGGSFEPRPLSYMPFKSVASPTSAPIEPTFINPFGYQLSDPHTQYWIQQLPHLEALLADEGNPNARRADQTLLNARRPVPLASSAAVSTLAPLEESIARYVLPNRFSVRRERLAFTIGVLKDLAPALQAMHSSDIIHRDVKPNNIMMSTLLEYTVPVEGSTTVAAVEGIEEVPIVFYDFLGQPENLLKRSRHIFTLIDLGWGRVLPSAMISMKPLDGEREQGGSDRNSNSAEQPKIGQYVGITNSDYGGSNRSSDDLGDDWEAFANRHEKKEDEGRHYEEDQFGHHVAQKVTVGLSMAVLQQQSDVKGNYGNPVATRPNGLQFWVENQGAGRPENSLAYSGYKRPREDDAIPPVPTLRGNVRFEPLAEHSLLPKAGMSTLPAMAILPVSKPISTGEDPRLYSMQRKLAALRPADPASPFTFSELAAMDPKDAETATTTSSQDDNTSSPSLPAAPAQQPIISRDFLMSGPAGNICYRAPEFMFGAHEQVLIEGVCSPDHIGYAYNASVDVFALGSVLFEFLTGTRMFKLRSNEIHQAEADLRNGQLLHRMVESLGYPKVWVAEAVVQIRNVMDSNQFPNIIKYSPYASARIRSTSAATTAYTYIGQIQTFLLSDSIRRNRIIDASSVESAMAYAWDEVVAYTIGKAKMLSMSEANGLTGAEQYIDGREVAAQFAAHVNIPARILGQHGFAGLMFQSLEQEAGGLAKRPSTSSYIMKHLQKATVRPAWAYEPKTQAGLGFRGLPEIDADRKMREEKALMLSAVAEASEAGLPKPTEVIAAPLRGTFSNVIIPQIVDPKAVKEGDRIGELVGLVTRMLSWEPTERPSMMELMESGAFALLCGDERGYFDS